MKNEIANQNLTGGNASGENAYFPYDRYGNYVAEMTPFMVPEAKSGLVKVSQPEDLGNAIGSIKPTLGIV